MSVVSLESHPTWRSAQRRSQELHDAMRRHPSYHFAQARARATEGTDAAVFALPRR